MFASVPSLSHVASPPGANLLSRRGSNNPDRTDVSPSVSSVHFFRQFLSISNSLTIRIKRLYSEVRLLSYLSSLFCAKSLSQLEAVCK